MIAEVVDTASQSILNTGVVGAVCLLVIGALVFVYRQRDGESKTRGIEDKAIRDALLKVANDKDAKIVELLEHGLSNSTTAINNNTSALKELERKIEQWMRGDK